MKTKTILAFLTFLAWLAMIGYSIECGSQIISLLVSFKNPAAAKQVYGFDQHLFSLHAYNKQYFINVMSLIIALSAMKATTWYLVIRLLSKLSLINPFSADTASKLETIAYQLLGIWVISIVTKAYIKWLTARTGVIIDVNVGDEFLFIAGLIYIISKIFRRGLELQEENQLTV